MKHTPLLVYNRPEVMVRTPTQVYSGPVLDQTWMACNRETSQSQVTPSLVDWDPSRIHLRTLEACVCRLNLAQAEDLINRTETNNSERQRAGRRPASKRA